MRCNLGLAVDWLKGKNLDDGLRLLAFQSLCLVCPVLSTTFAALPRFLAGIGREEIGWLLIDEAGQALPQAAAGAVWRAKRTVVDGRGPSPSLRGGKYLAVLPDLGPEAR